jgi:hypothetical protein
MTEKESRAITEECSKNLKPHEYFIKKEKCLKKYDYPKRMKKLRTCRNKSCIKEGSRYQDELAKYYKKNPPENIIKKLFS